ncbi:hypothetical protein [uncultured Kordia sp.]|uniref:hypothetical protein n=1 Tax=uncultured Kordia sp. TaxID=507699 RepID=UPI002623931D|nr:hypothetical protein [uncultured Kordia sp.]
MKDIYHINKIFYIITVGLYITVIYGLLMQFLLGCLQVLLFSILIFNFSKHPKVLQKHLIIYGVITGLYLMFYFSHNHFSIVHFKQKWTSLVLIPMSLGTYFTYIVYQLKNAKNQKTVCLQNEGN